MSIHAIFGIQNSFQGNSRAKYLPARKSSVRDKISIWQEIFTRADYSLRFFFFFTMYTMGKKPPAVIGDLFPAALRNEQPSNDVSILSHSRNFESLVRRLIFYAVKSFLHDSLCVIMHLTQHFFCKYVTWSIAA